MNLINYLDHFIAQHTIILAILTYFILAYHNVRLYVFSAAAAFFLYRFDVGVAWWGAYLIFNLLFLLTPIRRNLISRPIIFLIKKLNFLPKISETEKTALTSGTTWVDAQLFSGKPDFRWISKQYYPKLSEEEQDFLDNQTEELCKMHDEHRAFADRDLSPEVWQFLKEKRFFGMVIPKKYGGLGFSDYAHSAIIQKLSSRSAPLSITAMVPNSLGPAELLLEYGTQEQQDYYLPRLADGREVPCFALTEPEAGSDAGSITSNGVVFEDEQGQVKIRLNWSKRYITLGAVSTLLGLAFQLRDPENLLKRDKIDLGITCALIPTDTEGVILGRRHNPLGVHFVNSPVDGRDVIIGVDSIIGGENGIGIGWKMLMESLAAGRGISLPSTSCGAAKMVSRVVSAYSEVRKQFGISISKFEGIEEVLVRIFSKTYMLDALRCFTVGAVDSGAKPAVASAIAKYHSTEIFRNIINDGMDVMAGAAIIRGPRNLLASAYASMPISITVEGANIITRSLIHFGQGAIRCHPYAYKEIEALENNDLKSFDKAIFSHLGFINRNKIRSFILGLTRGYILFNGKFDLVSKYQRKIAWVSATFAWMADTALIFYGGDLKRKEKINGRLGDILSRMYLATSILRKFEAEGRKKSDEVVVDYLLRDLLFEIQLSFDDLYQNMLGGFLGLVLKYPVAIISRLNYFSKKPNDKLAHKLVKAVLQDENLRDSLTEGIHVPQDKKEALGRLENAFTLLKKAKDPIAKIKTAIKNSQLERKDPESLVETALEKQIISSDEARIIKESRIASLDAIQVDDFKIEDYKNNT